MVSMTLTSDVYSRAGKRQKRALPCVECNASPLNRLQWYRYCSLLSELLLHQERLFARLFFFELASSSLDLWLEETTEVQRGACPWMRIWWPCLAGGEHQMPLVEQGRSGGALRKSFSKRSDFEVISDEGLSKCLRQSVFGKCARSSARRTAKPAESPSCWDLAPPSTGTSPKIWTDRSTSSERHLQRILPQDRQHTDTKVIDTKVNVKKGGGSEIRKWNKKHVQI